jgi:hypothetical protein
MTMLVLVAESYHPCRNCQFRGEEYKYLSSFVTSINECTKGKCYCRCDGTISCPLRERYDMCASRCTKCTNPETGVLIAANSTFTTTSPYCFRFTWQCNCDGTYVYRSHEKIPNCKRMSDKPFHLANLL